MSSKKHSPADAAGNPKTPAWLAFSPQTSADAPHWERFALRQIPIDAEDYRARSLKWLNAAAIQIRGHVDDAERAGFNFDVDTQEYINACFNAVRERIKSATVVVDPQAKHAAHAAIMSKYSPLDVPLQRMLGSLGEEVSHG